MSGSIGNHEFVQVPIRRYLLAVAVVSLCPAQVWADAGLPHFDLTLPTVGLQSALLSGVLVSLGALLTGIWCVQNPFAATGIFLVLLSLPVLLIGGVIGLVFVASVGNALQVPRNLQYFGVAITCVLALVPTVLVAVQGILMCRKQQEARIGQLITLLTGLGLVVAGLLVIARNGEWGSANHGRMSSTCPRQMQMVVSVSGRTKCDLSCAVGSPSYTPVGGTSLALASSHIFM